MYCRPTSSNITSRHKFFLDNRVRHKFFLWSKLNLRTTVETFVLAGWVVTAAAAGAVLIIGLTPSTVLSVCVSVCPTPSPALEDLAMSGKSWFSVAPASVFLSRECVEPIGQTNNLPGCRGQLTSNTPSLTLWVTTVWCPVASNYTLLNDDSWTRCLKLYTFIKNINKSLLI